MEFRIGQKVECVDSTGEEPHLRRGVIYTVTRNEYLPQYINVSCCSEHEGVLGAGWRARRFRPIVECKTDISIFTKMLTGTMVGA